MAWAHAMGAWRGVKFPVARRYGPWYDEPDVDVAKPVDAADFNWSAHGEIRGAEPLKVGERYRAQAPGQSRAKPSVEGRCRDWTGGT